LCGFAVHMQNFENGKLLFVYEIKDVIIQRQRDTICELNIKLRLIAETDNNGIRRYP